MSDASALRKFLAHDPRNISLNCDYLDAALSEGRIDEAKAWLREAPVDVRENAKIRMREARIALITGDLDRSISILRSVLDTGQTDDVTVRHDLAYAQSCQGDDAAALETLASAGSEQASDVALAILKARILYRQKQYASALEALAPFVTGERMAEVHGLRAMLMLDTGRPDEAASEARKALANVPEQQDALLVTGTLALSARQTESAMDAFRRILAVRPQSARALLGLGESLMVTGDIAAARERIERAAAEMPDHIGTWHALAWCQLMEGDAAGAKHSFERAFAIDRTFGETHGGFALIHALRGERSEAEESIKRAKRLAPEGQTARYAQSVLLLDDGHPEEARRIVDGIVAHTPGNMPVMSADFIFRLRDMLRPRG